MSRMDSGLRHHKHSIPSSTPNHRPLLAQNARIQEAGFAMPLTDLCIKRIIIIPKPIRFSHHHKLFSGNANNVKTTLNMADEESNVKTSQFLNTAENEKNQDKKVEKSTASVDPPLPPPPEKPLPGDCCGSGCVRCVWDVYYEELEEYNKLCNPDLSKKSGK